MRPTSGVCACGATFQIAHKGPVQRVCVACQAALRDKAAAEWQRDFREPCRLCGAPEVRYHSVTGLCAACRGAR